MNDVVTPEVPTIRNAKKKAFADGVLAGKTGTQSAIDAGYSLRTAGTQAALMLKQPEIAAYVRYHRGQDTEEAKGMRAKLTEELSRISFSNVADFTRLNSDGDLEVDFSGATREQLSAVSGVKVKKRKIYNKGELIGEEHHSEFKLWDKIRAAELLGKDIGMFKEPDQKIVVDVADRLLAARQRIRAAVQSQTIDHEDG